MTEEVEAHCPGCGGWINSMTDNGYECGGLPAHPESDTRGLTGTLLREVWRWSGKPEPWTDAAAWEGFAAAINARLSASPDLSIDREGLREALAAIEHEQWIAWAQSILASEPISDARRERWAGYMVPYAELDEPTKDHDRKWADRILAALRGTSQQEREQHGPKGGHIEVGGATWLTTPTAANVSPATATDRPDRFTASTSARSAVEDDTAATNARGTSRPGPTDA